MHETQPHAMKDRMIQGLLAEFDREAESTRRLLQAIPDAILDWKPADISWTTAQLANHMAEIYGWYPSTLLQPVLDMKVYRHERGDTSTMAGILKTFEKNVIAARAALEQMTPERMMEEWSMVTGEQVLIPKTPRIGISRSFLMSHLYHHRGEMVVYLRATGNKVPGLYGPNYEESRAMGQGMPTDEN